MRFAQENNIKAGIILTCVGSLEQYNLRFANQKTGSQKTGYAEIVSLTGTFSASACHLHVALADCTGQTIGGHLLDDNLVYTTAEIALAELPDLLFERIPDPEYGYAELAISALKKNNTP
jgi:predicted DNA-binding protein with PD1-like motif